MSGEWLASVSLSTPQPILKFERGHSRGGVTTEPTLRNPGAATIVGEVRFYANATKRTLICERPETGLGALFWRRCDDELLLSGSPALLAKAGRTDAKVDPVILADQLRGHWPSSSETLFEGIYRVPPGHRLVVSPSSLEVVRYWYPHGPQAALEDFDGRLEGTVSRMVGPSRPGILLSGGLDSVSVAVALAKVTSAKPLALSMTFTGSSIDEGEIQRAVVRQLGFDLEIEDISQLVSSKGLLFDSVELSARYPLPLQNVWMPAFTELIRRAKARGVDVILTGHGGDEWLTVSPLYAADLISCFQFRALRDFVAHAHNSYSVHPRSASRNLLWTYGLRTVLARIGRQFARVWAPASLRRRHQARWRSATPAWISSDSSLRDALDERVWVASDPQPWSGFYAQAMDDSLVHPLASLDVEEYRALGLDTGVNMGHPYFAVDIVKALYRTPPKALYSGGMSKRPARSYLAKRFPGLGFENQRKAFASDYFTRRVREQAHQVSAHLGGFEALGDLGVLDISALNLGDVQDSAAVPAWKAVSWWQLLSTESWLRANV